MSKNSGGIFEKNRNILGWKNAPCGAS